MILPFGIILIPFFREYYQIIKDFFYLRRVLKDCCGWLYCRDLVWVWGWGGRGSGYIGLLVLQEELTK